MNIPNPFSLAALLLGSALGSLAPAVAAQVSVPGDFATPQDAVDGSPAGSTIVIAGGVWGTLVIDKELAIVGDPQVTFEGAIGPPTGFKGLAPAIYLDGPGAGRVTLVNVLTSASYEGFRGFQPSHVTAGIAGGNFDSLRLYDCTILGVE